jgi:hypothetical protein
MNLKNTFAFYESRWWLAVSWRRIIGSILFQDTINGVRSREQILEIFINQLYDEEQQFGYFQHDGGLYHKGKTSNNFLITIHQISQHFNPEACSFPWPHSFKFSIFGRLKDIVYKQPLQNVEQLMHEITIVVKILVRLCCRTFWKIRKGEFITFTTKWRASSTSVVL